MPSSASSNVLFELQAAGENLNTWGDKLNTALKMLEAAGHGFTEHTLTSSKSYTYTNYTLTDGTDFAHKFVAASDGSYTVTLGGYERTYFIWNDSGFSQTVNCSGGGDSVTIEDGEFILLYCDATNVKRLNLSVLSGALTVNGRISGVTDPSDNQDAATKGYVDAVAFNSVDLPGQSGAAGRFLSTDGSNAGWEAIDQIPAQSGNAGYLITTDGSTASFSNFRGAERITSATTADVRLLPYYCDTSGGEFTLTLPAAPSDGDIVEIRTGEDAEARPVTLGRNGNTIEDRAEDLIVDTNFAHLTLIYRNSSWRI